MNYKDIDKIMHQGLDQAVFPGAVLFVAQKQKILFFNSYGYADIFSKEKMNKDTIFDLASLTKPLAAALAIAALIEEGKAEFNTAISEIIPEFYDKNKKKITIGNLLYHNSGLSAYKPYYKTLEKEQYIKRKKVLLKMICAETLIAAPGKKELYSDIGFMLLTSVIEVLSGTKFENYIYKIYKPLNMKMFFTDNSNKNGNKKFASTEKCFWRKKILKGVVHDQNAYIIGGTCGHAGLFGRAKDIYNLLCILISIYKGCESSFLKPTTVIKLFKRNQNGTRSLGFDMPSDEGASCGKYFSANSVGHLGYTGVSFWADINKEKVVILLANRIHLYCSNKKIRNFRPLIHNAAMMNL